MKREKLTVKQKIAKRIELRHQNLVFIDKKGQKKMDEQDMLRIYGKILPPTIKSVQPQLSNENTVKSIIKIKKQISSEPISIIITAYQTENYIEECLDSIENQTYFFNNNDFEVLVGIDACKKTLDHLLKISHKYRNLRIFMMNSNMGTYVTSNTLLDLVKYNNIIRFDSDDVMKSQMVEEIIKHVNDFDVIKFGYNTFTDNINTYSDGETEVDGAIFYKRDIIKLVGGYREWKCAADTELMNRIFQHAKIQKTGKQLFYRRQHPNSLTNKFNTGTNSGLRKKYIKEIRKYEIGEDTFINRVINGYKEVFFKNDIAVIMCIWKRVSRLHKTIKDFQKQSHQYFDVYFWNNDYSQKNDVDNIIKKLNFKSNIYHSLINEGGFGRFLYAKDIYGKYKTIVFIDDDQNFDENFILNFKNQFKLKSAHSWYCWKLDGSYWNRTRVGNEEEGDYCGTGGMMIDSTIFKNELVYQIPEKYKFVEDLWLSYIVKNIFGWKLYGINQNITFDIDKLDQFNNKNLKEIKGDFWKYLINSGNELNDLNDKILIYSEISNNNFSLSRKIPKRIFFYWGGSDLSWMRYMTLYSFRKMNPDWEIVLYVSNNTIIDKEWESYELQDFFNYRGKNYFNKLNDLNIKIEKAEFPLEIRSKLKNLSPIHEGDLYRYYQLYIGGGFYCDMDVLFFKPMDDYYNKIVNGQYDTIIHEYLTKYGWALTIGFLGASVNNEFYKNLFEYGINDYITTTNKRNDNYQSFGNQLIYRMFDYKPFMEIMWDKFSLSYGDLKFHNLLTPLIYNFDFTQINYCFNNSLGINNFSPESIGYHWYGGSPTSQKYNNILTEKNYKEYKTTFSNIANAVINMKINKNKNIIKNNPMISIVTAYYNRKSLFYETLKSIARSNHKNIELIVVDDGSSIEHRLEEYLTVFPFMKIIRLEKENKWYANPCIPFNIGIRAAVGDIIMLQNPECLHVHDILTYVSENIDDRKYITMSAYYLDEKTTKELPKYSDNNYIADYLKTLPQQGTGGDLKMGWFNHSIHRPVYYHFCSAITKKNMNLLGGFDERYANGISYDDNEFIERIGRLGLNKVIADNVSVIHLWHPTFYYADANFMILHEKNRLLFENVTKKETGYKVNNSAK